MKKTIAAAALLVAVLAAAGAATATASASADPSLQSASGFGQIHLGLPFRNFAFSAAKQADGTTTGQAQFERRDSGVRVHIDIDCLNVLGNVAVMSGVVSSTNSDNLTVGTTELFAVRDNGEGPNVPADEFTLTFPGLGIPCTYITDPTQLALAFVHIESGQIQVSS